MNSKTAVLTTDLTYRTNQSFQNLDPDRLMNKLLTMGYQAAILDGAFIEQFSDGIFIFIEEDIKFLISEYLYLEELTKKTEPYQHETCLNDARFCLTSTSDRKIVEIQMQYCPSLKVANLINFATAVSEDSYVNWWRNIAHEILSFTVCA